MHSLGAMAQTSPAADGRMRPWLRSCLVVLLGVLVFCLIALAAPQAGGKAGGQAGNAAPADFAGSDTCASCHADVAARFADNPHVKLAQMHGQNGVTCENCHGPGKAHAGGGDPGKIFNPAKGPAREVDARCLPCHQGKHSNPERSGHGEANVSCVNCHRVHAGNERLIKAAQPALCFECHADAKPQFSMASHHQVEEGRMQCTDCHDPHGAFGLKGLKSAAQQDAVCTRCHGQMAGPFVYEHDAVKTEGCTACHFPHGGPNPRLLNRASVNTICQQCHSPSMASATPSTPAPTAHSQAGKDQPCTMCHADIHGSNVHPNFFKTSL